MRRSTILVALLVTLAAGAAFGCSCLPPTTEQAFDRADLVFLGTVKQVTFSKPASSRVIVEFDVSRVWKGHAKREFEMRSEIEYSDCEGFYESDLIVGKKLLVFANRRMGLIAASYNTNICTLTGPLERSGNTLEKLGAGRPPN